MELEEDDTTVASRRPPRRFEIRIRKTNRDIIMEDLYLFCQARNNMTNNCEMGKFFFSFPFFNKNESHNRLLQYLYNKQ